jgi:uncharacterized protein (TIGR00645 family)
VKRIEAAIEFVLFGGRWLMAPIYLGLLGVVAAIAVKFFQELVHALPGLLSMSEHEFVPFVLSLVDLALLGNLTLMMIYVGYENFVSKLHADGHEDRPHWITHVDFSGLKLKLLGSIVAISAIHLLQTFMNIADVPKEDVGWQLAIHLGFVVSGLLLAVMDRLSAAPPAHGPD